MLTLRLAVRNALRHRMRSIVTLSAIAFGCVSLIFAGGFFDDVYIKIRENEISAHTGHLQIFRKGYLESGKAQPFDYMIDDYNRVGDAIRQIKGVSLVAPALPISGLLSVGETAVSFVGEGADPSQLAVTPVSKVAAVSRSDRNLIAGLVLEQGEPLRQDRPNEVLLGKGLAEALSVKVGEEPILLTRTTDQSINGSDVRVSGIFSTGAKEVDDYALILPLSAAQRLVRTEAIQSFRVKIQNTDNLPRVKRDLENLFAAEHLDLELRTWDQLSEFAGSTNNLFHRFFLVIRIVIGLIMTISIYNTVNMAVVERTVEVGTIMAMGVKRRGVIKQFLLEGIVLGTVGGLIGASAGALLTIAVSQVGIPMPPPPGFTVPWLSEPLVRCSNVGFSFCLALASAALSSLAPAYRASKLEIAQALRHTN